MASIRNTLGSTLDTVITVVDTAAAAVSMAATFVTHEHIQLKQDLKIDSLKRECDRYKEGYQALQGLTEIRKDSLFEELQAILA